MITSVIDIKKTSFSNVSDNSNVPKVVVIGGGISGLTAAYTLSQEAPDYEVVLLEASSKLGGVIQTTNSNGMLIEAGPESFVTFKPATIQLAQKLNISHHLINTNTTNRRTFVGYKGKLHPLPDGFMMFAPTKILPLATSRLFSIQGKLRMGLDLVLPAKQTSDDESLASFVKRRLGNEVFEKIAEPLVGGIYGGNPEYLSAQFTVGRFVEYERRHGSIIKGLWKENRSTNTKPSCSGANYSMFASFDNGMKVLTDALIAQLPKENIQTNKEVVSINHGKTRQRYDIVCKDGSIIVADAIVIAAPAYKASKFLEPLHSNVESALNRIKYRSATIINLVFKNSDIVNKCAGFGFVVPRTEPGVLRALSISSHKFANRVPDNMTLLRAFVGDTTYSNTELQNLLSKDLNLYLGIKSDPVHYRLFTHQGSMPQHGVGHRDLVQEISNHIKSIPGVALAGNAYQGIGISDCIESGQNAAVSVLSFLKTQIST